MAKRITVKSGENKQIKSKGPTANKQSRTVKIKANKQPTAKSGEYVPGIKSKTSEYVPGIKAKTSEYVPGIKSKGPANNPQMTAKTGGEATTLTANTTPMVGQLSATFAPNPNLSALEEASLGEMNEVQAVQSEIANERLREAAKAPNPKTMEKANKVKVRKKSTPMKRDLQQMSTEVEAGRGAQYVKES